MNINKKLSLFSINAIFGCGCDMHRFGCVSSAHDCVILIYSNWSNLFTNLLTNSIFFFHRLISIMALLIVHIQIFSQNIFQKEHFSASFLWYSLLLASTCLSQVFPFFPGECDLYVLVDSIPPGRSPVFFSV